MAPIAFGLFDNNQVKKTAQSALVKSGNSISDKLDEADVVVLEKNTKTKSAISLYSQKKPSLKFVVVGEFIPSEAAALREDNELVATVNPKYLDEVSTIVDELAEGRVIDAIAQTKTPQQKHTNTLIASVGIGSGIKQEYIINMVKKNVERGCKEIVLTSAHSTVFGMTDEDQKIGDLLHAIMDQVEGEYKIRLDAISIRRFLDDRDSLLAAYQEEKMFKYAHIPFLSGNNEVLGKMKKKFTVGQYKDIVDDLKRFVPNIFIKADVMVGHAAESELQFQDTLHVLQEVKADECRVNTSQAKADKPHDKEVQQHRKQEVAELVERNRNQYYTNFIGQETAVLVYAEQGENVWYGKTPEYRTIVLKGELTAGQVYPAQIDSVEDGVFIGSVVDND